MLGFALGGCADDGHAPQLVPLAEQHAIAGSEFALVLRAHDADGDALTFTYTAEAHSLDAELHDLGDGAAVFRWTPDAADLGLHAFDFSVSDGAHETIETVNVLVKSAAGADGTPSFVHPLGTGTTFDVSQSSCMNLVVAVDDSDSSSVVLDHAAPVFDRAWFEQDGALSGVWRWCPDLATLHSNRYTLRLIADDGVHAPTIKEFLIVLVGLPGDVPPVEDPPSDDPPGDDPPGDGPPNDDPPLCSDDAHEDDDNASQARWVDLNLGTYEVSSNVMCSADDDWFEVYMYAGETLTVSLGFEQNSDAEDLDIILVKGGDALTPCNEQDPFGCDPSNGQSATANELLEWPVTESGTYHVVVRGWDGAQNDYDACIGYYSGACP